MEKLNLTQEWDKVFPKSDKVDHKKVTFHNRYGITLAADMYTPRGTEGKLPAIAVCALRRVHIRRQRDAVAVVKGYFLVIHLVAFREHLVPFLCQIQFFHIQTSLPVALKYAVLSTASNHSLEVSSPGTSTAR